MAVPVVQAAALCGQRGGEFVMVTGLAAARAGGAPATVRARCRAVGARMPGRPVPPPLTGPAVSRRPR
jgi:hypothetical protein